VDSSEVLFSLKGDAAESLLGCFIVILAAIPNEERVRVSSFLYENINFFLVRSG
jgi:hypothetical protein